MDTWDLAPVGLARVRIDGQVEEVNAFGRDLLGSSAPAEVFSPADLLDLDAAEGERIIEAYIGDRLRALSCRLGSSPAGRVLVFRDVTKQRHQQRRIAAIASTAASVASERSLTVSLGAISREVARADGLAGVQVLVSDPRVDDGLRVMGSAGFPRTSDFFNQLVLCRDRGASLKMLEAYETAQPVVVPHRYQAVMGDAAWAPMHEYLRSPRWDSFVSMPLIAAGRPIGILNAFFSPGQPVDDDALTFLSTMADQAALAIDYAELLEQQRQDAGRAERQRLARELHDSVVQQVFSIGMQTEALKLLSARGDAPSWQRVGPVAQELEAMSRSVLSDLRNLVAQLHPAPPTTNGFFQALRELVTTTQRRSDLNVTLTCPMSVDELGDALSEDVYFIIAEAVHNAVKHAGATTIDIRLDHLTEAGELDVRVHDDGRGFCDSRKRVDGGYGLTSMKERAELWRGTLTVDTNDNGTCVLVRVPTLAVHPTVIGAQR
jgi:signal transduction histidine kinase